MLYYICCSVELANLSQITLEDSYMQDQLNQDLASILDSGKPGIFFFFFFFFLITHSLSLFLLTSMFVVKSERNDKSSIFISTTESDSVITCSYVDQYVQHNT